MSSELPAEYVEFLTAAQAADLRHIEVSRVFFRWDALFVSPTGSLPVFCLCPSNIPDASEAFLAQLEMFCIRSLHQAAQTGRYVIVYCHHLTNDLLKVNRFALVKQIYRRMPRMLRKSIHELHVLHPNFWLKSLFAFMRPFVSSKFWRKLHYTDHIAELSARLKLPLLLPEYVVRHDRGETGGSGILMTIPYVGPPPSIAAAGGPHAGSVPDERVFGMPLSVSCSPERGAVNGIPSPLQACAAFVEANGAMVEGIYRVPGSHTLIQQLIAAFDHSSETLFPLYHVIVGGLSTTSAPAVDSSPVLLPGSLSLYSGPSIEAPSPMSSPILSVDSVMPVIPSSVIKPEDVHVAASVVKAFFRQLPDPLVPTFCNERLLPLAAEEDAPVDALKEVFTSIPPENLLILRFLVKHLHTLAGHAAVTGMDAANLGTCFGPNVLRPTVEGADPITAINQTRALNRILFWCIANPAIVN